MLESAFEFLIFARFLEREKEEGRGRRREKKGERREEKEGE